MPRCIQNSLSNDHVDLLCRNPILTRIPDHCRRTQIPSHLLSLRCLRRIPIPSPRLARRFHSCKAPHLDLGVLFVRSDWVDHQAARGRRGLIRPYMLPR